jgi:trk system potassium uptake protein
MPTPGDILDALDREVQRSLSIWRRLTAAQLFVGSFLTLILIGTILLLVLPGIYTGPRLSFIDALFTATSAVCITGLVVVDTATYFTPFGQAVLLLLFQAGGIGILTFTTLIIILLGRRITLRGESAIGATLPHFEPPRLVRGVFIFTFAVEGVAAVVLWILWAPRLGAVEAIWPAVFHAVSAFCNAGFSVLEGSLTRFAGDPFTIVFVSLVVLIGGTGFLVMEELRLRLAGVRRRLSLHSKLVLVMTGIVVIAGMVLALAFEWNNLLAPFPAHTKIAEAFFLTATARTAGFNTLDYSGFTSATLFLTIVIMIIGGSPGSTAGGLKTTTVAIIAVLALARLRGREKAAAFHRTIPDGTIERAVGLVVFGVAIMAAAMLILQVTELGGLPHPQTGGLFLDLAFEAASAFNTVGLSTGVTPELSPAGRVLISLLMFVGRVGPFTLVASMALAANRPTPHYRYSTEDVIVG